MSVMQGLSAILPAPVSHVQQATLHAASRAAAAAPKEIPPYGQRKGWTPRAQDDFAGGGAFPEVHVAQYPLDMGRKGKTQSQVVALTTDGEGNVKYDAIARVGKRDGSKVYTSLSDLREKAMTGDELARPDEDAIAATTAATKAALEKRVEGKIAAAHNPRGMPKAGKAAERAAPTFIRYTPAEAGAVGAQNRVIRMVEAARDPMDPPKFKHKRVPGGPPSPPAPVLHSPERKLTQEDAAAWKIPPCISSWKNAKGYTVPLDKRLAADGRGLQEVQVSDNFAKLSESLYIAERAAREEVEQRSQLQKRLAMKEKAGKEEDLRLLAQRAREERAHVGGGAGSGDESGEDAEASALAAEREDLRRERKRERERERRLEGAGGAGAEGAKRGKMARERERDVSERIALGQANPTVAGESQYDQRLFNQAQGMDSGLGGDDANYNIYDKALFAQTSAAAALYRPKKVDDDGWGGGEEAVAARVAEGGNKFRPDKGFAGTEGGGGGRSGGPVEFEKEDADPFGLDKFITEADGKKAHKK
ncbi:SKIP/SNW domain-containing protein [Pavlovales sp. CCMP2436]|nr:SKIP/SNW domain-containing protein [Pavlovales sp. CCMP2436]